MRSTSNTHKLKAAAQLQSSACNIRMASLRHQPHPLDPAAPPALSYVRITLGDSEGGRTPFFEAQTRTCHRNRNPMWEQW